MNNIILSLALILYSVERCFIMKKKKKRRRRRSNLDWSKRILIWTYVIRSKRSVKETSRFLSCGQWTGATSTLMKKGLFGFWIGVGLLISFFI